MRVYQKLPITKQPSLTPVKVRVRFSIQSQHIWVAVKTQRAPLLMLEFTFLIAWGLNRPGRYTPHLSYPRLCANILSQLKSKKASGSTARSPFIISCRKIGTVDYEDSYDKRQLGTESGETTPKQRSFTHATGTYIKQSCLKHFFALNVTPTGALEQLCNNVP